MIEYVLEIIPILNTRHVIHTTPTPSCLK